MKIGEIARLFEDEGGSSWEADWPGIPAKHHETFRGTRYLKEPGVALVGQTSHSLSAAMPFLEGFGFKDYARDPFVLSPAAGLTKFAGQLCYMSLGEQRTKNADAERYFEGILSSGHGSVLEHASLSFLLYGISRSQTHELVRHRAGCAYSQVSQRYVSGKLLRFLERPEYQGDKFLHNKFEERINRAVDEYDDLADILTLKQQGGNTLLSGEAKTEQRKKVNQAARSCLPNETEAPILFTANGRALRHVVTMRAAQPAEVEIRRLAYRMFLVAAKAWPLLFLDAARVVLPDGTSAVELKYLKV